MPSEREKIIANKATDKELISKIYKCSPCSSIPENEATDKGLISKIYKQLLKLNS